MLYGLIQDFTLISIGLMDTNSFFPPIWLISMWIVFIAYYDDFFVRLKDNKMINPIIGGLGGLMAYWGGTGLAGVEVTSPFWFSVIVFLSWFIFFPLSLWLYFLEESEEVSFFQAVRNSFLDKTIFFSFDSSGFHRHRKINPNFQESLNQGGPKTGLITGGSSGIGEAAILELRDFGHRVLTCGRRQLEGKQDYFQLDMSDWKQIDDFVEQMPELDFVGLNAGGMPESFSTNDAGIELQMASQLFGHFYLIKKLLTLKKLRPGARVVWMSSGGMYLKKLHFDSVFSNPSYDKIETYANVKRAQVILADILSSKPLFSNIQVFSMHPGWVDTPGVQDSIPGFWKYTKNRLRSPKQGADTLVWLFLTQKKLDRGGFYFDRQKVSPHLFSFTKESQADREKLWNLLEEYTS